MASKATLILSEPISVFRFRKLLSVFIISLSLGVGVEEVGPVVGRPVPVWGSFMSFMWYFLGFRHYL